MSSVATIKKTPSEQLLNDKWDVVISNAVVKTALGFGFGVGFSVLFFKRRAFPVWLGIGFGAGRGWSEGDAIFRGGDAGVRIVKS
ncbi:hypothetical protein BZA70DRAFT_276210 [Myxozyma melibiosi]|uniref:MICOS complex subunit MIC10 n=1 Tax=Myxozyma melibiosi TaxID=54550 RepID=A0ABR1F8X7_9ASCO